MASDRVKTLEAWHAGRTGLNPANPMIGCPKCNATGAVRHGREFCPLCGGTGRVLRTRAMMAGYR